ncbi:hypothetical protein FNV43_RR19041 [Rhamnella rubrinervis]|uniref:Uncharacterized protein n=1 Tax=Rhamnella rubrinervis TaxID=2594499 RepID=A0A8K0GY64_9ROSA|nr:hypothetical protein FNV43_RR19041 [Rhamnella rubrinervis]
MSLVAGIRPWEQSFPWAKLQLKVELVGAATGLQLRGSNEIYQNVDTSDLVELLIGKQLCWICSCGLALFRRRALFYRALAGGFPEQRRYKELIVVLWHYLLLARVLVLILESLEFVQTLVRDVN